MDILKKIFSINLKCVKTAKIFIDRLSQMVPSSAKGIAIYIPSTQKLSFLESSSDLDTKMSMLYQIDNFKSFYKNSFSYGWIKDLRKNIKNFLKSDESLLFLDLLKILPDNKKLDLEVIKNKSVIEIQKIITFCIHNGLLKSEQESCIEWNWFYCEISATISNFYLQSDLNGSRKEKYIYNLLSLYENFTEFKYKNYKAFSDIRCIELFKQYHNYELSPAIIQHYNFKLIENFIKDSEILSKIKFMLKIQSVEITSNLLNFALTENLFETLKIQKSKKIHKAQKF